MRNTIASLITTVAIVMVAAGTVQAHCQVPCGIYGDDTRFDIMLEHVTTIEKSMKQITELSGADKPNNNQIVRWVNNKEVHADGLSKIVTYYFLAQRIKPVTEKDKKAFAKYQSHLTMLHKIIVHSMKAKQTTDTSHCVALRTLIDDFHKSYGKK